jgi:hypothetical protein
MWKKKNTITISEQTIEKLRVVAEIAGCSSIEEFAERVLSKAADDAIASTSKREASAEQIEEIKNQLAGLGYLE